MLQICSDLFYQLRKLNITYCHWKSNIRLEESLAGKTDLDILVDETDIGKFKTVLRKFKFIEAVSPSIKRYKSLEDYLGFDHNSGKFIHLHVHYKLILGQRFIKNHHLPIEDIIFGNLIEKDDIFIPCPEIELAILIIRAFLKVDLLSIAKQGLKNAAGIRDLAFTNDLIDELRVLIKSVDINKFQLVINKIQLNLKYDFFKVFIDSFLNNSLGFHDILVLKYKTQYALRDFRREKSVRIYLTYFALSFFELPIICKLRPKYKKRIMRTNNIFSIVGADGSGKSTIIKELDEWLSWKITVKRYYYGIPKNFINKYLYGYLTKIFKKLGLDPIVELIDAVFWYFMARYRYRTFQQTTNIANKRIIVITDRFPLKEFHNMKDPMDGPRILEKNNMLFKYLKYRETEYYQKIVYPKKIILLKASLSELRKRKRDLSLESHTQKANAVNQVNGSNNIYVVDANRPLEEVIISIKREIWNSLLV